MGARHREVFCKNIFREPSFIKIYTPLRYPLELDVTFLSNMRIIIKKGDGTLATNINRVVYFFIPVRLMARWSF